MRDAIAFDRSRFGEFQKSLGLARNILAARLRKLVSHGVLELVPASDGSAYRKYVPTERGKALYIVLTALRQWQENFAAPGTFDTVLVDAARGEPVRPLELRSQDGRLLGPGDIKVVRATDVRRLRGARGERAGRRRRSS